MLKKLKEELKKSGIIKNLKGHESYKAEAGKFKWRIKKMLGIVKWFDEKKGYGFVTDNETGADYFCHFSSIISEEGYKILKEGQKVSFDEDEKEEKRLRAKNVRKV